MQSHYQQEIYNPHHYQPHNVVPPQTFEEIEDDDNVELLLDNKVLWESFSQFVTEMIITRAGRYAKLFRILLTKLYLKS